MSSNGSEHLSVEAIREMYEESLNDSLERRRLDRERRRRVARTRLAFVLVLLVTMVLLYVL